MKTLGPINLLVSRFVDPDPVRNEEYLTCLRRNVANPYITAVYLFDETTDGSVSPVVSQKIHVIRLGRRVTFQDFFRFASTNLRGQICAAINADIFLDYSLAELVNYNLRNTLLCLSRWDEQPDGSSRHLARAYSQDAWIFLAPIKEFPSDWHLGFPKSETKITFEARRAGMKTRNPSLFIRARHLHASGVRHYVEGKDDLPGPGEEVPIDAHRPMKQDGIAVSAVCLTTYPKRAGMLDEAIASFVAQSFSLASEMVIVNDGTPIRSLEPSVVVVNIGQGFTLGEKRNIGTANSQGEAIACFDDDDISLENRFEDQFRILQESGAGYIKSDSLWIADGAMSVKGLLKSPSFGTNMVRKDVLDKVGGYPSVRWAEDMELYIRIRMRRIPIVTMHTPFYVYRRHSDNISTQSIGEDLKKLLAVSDRNHPDMASVQARVNRIIGTKKKYVEQEAEIGDTNGSE